MLLFSSAIGPESLAFDTQGQGPYTGVSNGRILKWQGHTLGWQQFATTTHNRTSECDGMMNMMTEEVCGRPLGLQFNRASGDLYIADAYFGLLVVGREGGVATQLTAAADGVPFHFTNGLDIDQENGIIYFTDSSTHFQRRENMWAVLAGDATGRLMKYNPISKTVTVLVKDLKFPNGVALNKDNTFLLVAETTTCRLLRYWLQGPKSGTLEVFAQLPGYPDNIKKNPKGDFWVALNQEKVQIPRASKVDGEGSGWPFEHPVAMKLSEEGEVLEVLDGKVLTSISEVEEGDNGTLWIGSVVMPYVAVYKN
ncbi:hypothetical protein J5N97_026583 [Dioscorea zingiberensis]|uniref:Strictosidine synthase conserved region domain-containing protein n=1 Tax=Dioscorea zingiberensis TaxID=325984 RepID=A0A9D5H6X1_9LILI|nr:hypothetical protein J5N97_026583 [Dioscorea zingiberensis]